MLYWLLYLQVVVHVSNNTRLGLRIRGGTEFGIGIFVSSVDQNRVAERAGIRVSKITLLLSSLIFLSHFLPFSLSLSLYIYIYRYIYIYIYIYLYICMYIFLFIYLTNYFSLFVSISLNLLCYIGSGFKFQVCIKCSTLYSHVVLYTLHKF